MITVEFGRDAGRVCNLKQHVSVAGLAERTPTGEVLARQLVGNLGL
jgi:hypothetical protein